MGPKVVFRQEPVTDHPPPGLSFGVFTLPELQTLAQSLGVDLEVFLAKPHGLKVPAGSKKNPSHCNMARSSFSVSILAVHSHGHFHVILIRRQNPEGWHTDLEKDLMRDGKTLLQFFKTDLQPHLRSQRRSSVDFSDPRAMMCYGWCYYVTWYKGCCHKRSFVKDKKEGRCQPNPNVQMLGLKARHSLSSSLQRKYGDFLTSAAMESGWWVEVFFPGTSQMFPTKNPSCLHTPHFTSFTLAFDACQFVHRDRKNKGFTNILNLCDNGTVYHLGLANFSLEGCDLCDCLTVEYGNLNICSVFSQDLDHFVSRVEDPVAGGRVALLFYGHPLEENLHGQEGQIDLWRNVITIRDQVLSRMKKNGISSPAQLGRVEDEYNRLLSSCKNPDKASTEKGCLSLMAEMQKVKDKRDARKKTKKK